MEALIGLAGIVVGALLGATGTYFRLRRDAWIEARANGLVLLADVRALRKAEPTDQVVARTQLGVKTWDSRAEALVTYRRGNYPGGLQAGAWLKLARHFARLRELGASTRAPDASWWRDVREELIGAETLLAPFARDEPVLAHVVVTSLREGWKTVLASAISIAVVILFVVFDLPWWAVVLIVVVAITIVAVLAVPWWLRTGRGAPRGPDLSRRVEKIVGYPPLCDVSATQRLELQEELLEAGGFEDLPGKWQAAILEAEQNGPKQ